MKIIIVDDTTENLEAAKNASKAFSGHEFRFFSSANEAVEALKSADGIISDLFFVTEECNKSLKSLYESYKMEMNHSVFYEVVEKYYGGNRRRAENKKADAVALLEDGTIRYAVEELIAFFKNRMQQGRSKYEREMDAENIQKFEKVLKNLPAPQFPFGGALIREAKKRGKAACLVSDIHRHAGEYKDAVGAIDGMALLIPLMGAGVFSVEQGMIDGEGSVTYIGGDQIWELGKWERKTSPEVWKKAIENCIAQVVL